jgi:acetylornithine/succinyldiaminopimelate/putrescine aminotransferase
MSSKDLFNKLKSYECPDATMRSQVPVVLEKAKGSLLWDVEKTQYIDLCAGFGSLAIGHNHPKTLSLYRKDFLTQGMGDVFTSRDKIELFEQLQSFLPFKQSQGSLFATGSQAVEFALKTAYLHSKKNHFIVFSGGYHGLDLGVLPLVSQKRFKQPFTGLLNKNTTTLEYGCDVEEIRTILKKIPCAGVVVEPILGRGGVVVPPKNWLKNLRQVCREEQTLLIFDEILTGLGRSGKTTVADLDSCDIICLGKALGGGMPLSGCFASPEIMSSWPECTGEAIHTGTFFGHPLSCRIGAQTLKIIAQENLSQRSKELGQEFKEQIKENLAHHPLFKEVRGQGLMIAIEFTKKNMGAQISEALLKENVICIPCGKEGKCLSLTPALNIEKKLLTTALFSIKKCLQQYR